MIAIKYSQKGTAWAVEIQGDSEQEVTQTFWSFWNHGATSGEFKWLGNLRLRGYFWTDEKRFKKALVNRALFYILQEKGDKFKGRKGGAMKLARYIASRQMRTLEPSEYFGKFSDTLTFTYADLRGDNTRTPLQRELAKYDAINA